MDITNLPGRVSVEVLKKVIPTYALGKPEKNPIFFEKRVYQGSNGKVYPIPFIDKVYDHILEKRYQTVTLENDFVRLVLLPEIGGRIFEAQDKSNNNYNFFYKQEVIKPALVGLAGPWISGGVEFNWPQHHRPGTYLPSDFHIEYEANGSVTVWMSEYDPLNRMKGMHGIRLRPDSSLVELRARLFNRTPKTQTFLWWANVAVQVHDQYQSFFPPDVHYVADHAVRAMSSFPIADNEYYGIPYGDRAGKNDLRWYKNIPVPTSYMVCETDFNFFGGYDHTKNGGFIHVADRHIAPGKKQWTWGSSAFGQAWDKELTDEGGPYIELMAGVYTDNQPDFSYLAPFETKVFSQFWYPIKNIGPVQNANNDLAIRLEFLQDSRLDLGVASSKHFENVDILLKRDNEIIRAFENVNISPSNPWRDRSFSIEANQRIDLKISVQDHEGKELLSFVNKEFSNNRNRTKAKEPPEAKIVENQIDLSLIAEHLEQYRHPTRYPEPYLDEALDRNPRDFQAMIQKGKLLLANGQLSASESMFREAVAVVTDLHPNPQSGEAHYYAGLSCFYLGKISEAYAFLYKSTWDYTWRSAGYYLLANIDCMRKNYEKAFMHLETSLDTNRQNNKALILISTVKRRQGRVDEAIEILENLLANDPLDQWAIFELGLLQHEFEAFHKSSRNDAQTIIDIAFDYADAGFYEEAIQLIEWHHKSEIVQTATPNPMEKSPMTWFLLGWLYDKIRQPIKSKEILISASEQNPDYFFPSRLNEQILLEWVIDQGVNPALAAYGLGNYLFDKKRHSEALEAWELASTSKLQYATLYRNLGIAYWNHSKNGEQARSAFEKAIELSPEDMRIMFEYDQLRKKLNDSPESRLVWLEPMKKKIATRDDFSVELAALYNFSGQYEKALNLIESKTFHPWEGGEGQVLRQYTNACIGLGRIELEKEAAGMAIEYFVKADQVPDNLGEKYHPLQSKAHINYWKGKALKKAGKINEAQKQFELSTSEQGDFVDMAVSQHTGLSYFRALSLLELDKQDDALKLLKEMKSFALEKLSEKAEIDYFATSLPLLLVFEEDLDKRNQWEAYYLLALSEIGLGNLKEGKILLEKVLELNTMHYGANEMFKNI
jgi:tetratricopeptide (TPR) repeat protein